MGKGRVLDACNNHLAIREVAEYLRELQLCGDVLRQVQ